jgi:hypothetical protein
MCNRSLTIVHVTHNMAHQSALRTPHMNVGASAAGMVRVSLICTSIYGHVPQGTGEAPTMSIALWLQTLSLVLIQKRCLVTIAIKSCYVKSRYCMIYYTIKYNEEETRIPIYH